MQGQLLVVPFLAALYTSSLAQGVLKEHSPKQIRVLSQATGPTKGSAQFKKPTGQNPVPTGVSSAWTQWGGPYRTFKSDTKGLAAVWPTGGPRKIWSRPLGEGYSGIAAENGVLYTMYYRAAGVGQTSEVDREVVVALNASTGKTLWEYAYDAPFKNAYSEVAGPGPYSMPQILGDNLYAVGGTGKLHALNKKTGKVIWFHDLYTEFNGTYMKFGYSCHALPYKNSLILMVGGPRHALMAFSQSDGRVIWHNLDFANAHSSPVLINVDGQDQVVAFMEKDIIGVEPNNGELLWSHPHTTQLGMAISMPVWGEDNLLFFSSSYDGGSRVLHITRVNNKSKVTELWHNNRLVIHFGSIVRIGDTIYGSSGHGGPAPFTAADVKTGKILWQTRDLAKANFIFADGKFILLDQDGSLALATPSPDGLSIHSKTQLLSNHSWTIPTLIGTKLYLRDRKTIMALELKESSGSGETDRPAGHSSTHLCRLHSALFV